MAKFTLDTVKSKLSIGKFTPKTIKFRGADGEEHEGEVLIKNLSYEELVNATDVFKVKDPLELKNFQWMQARVFAAVYEDEKKRFFPNIKETGCVSPEFLNRLYDAADEVLDFTGKNWASQMMKNFGVNSSSTESVEEQ